ncbi:hypothetical protein PanWU01x14_363880, partial [Parasponia andersonii]
KDDVLVWDYGRTGRYSVNTAYRLALSEALSACSTSLIMTKWWKGPWKEHTPPKVEIIWRYSDLWQFIRPLLCESLDMFLPAFFALVTKDNFERFSVLQWAIWNNWNNATHGDPVRSEGDLVDFILNYIDEFRTSSSMLATVLIPSTRGPNIHWSPPACDQLKLNSDVEIREGTGFIGVGVGNRMFLWLEILDRLERL